VLYVRGETSRGDIDRYAHGLQDAGVRALTAKLVADAGHFVADEQPAELWRLIHEFITGPDTTP
jgi:pimeloyl-ACP methyl ester carboxylesterase